MRPRRSVALLILLAACGEQQSAARPSPSPGGSARVPLVDLGSRRYLGFPGGLYPGGNELPGPHAAEGTLRATAMRALDGAGRPSGGGRLVVISIGMSNTTQEFCSQGGGLPCDGWTFMGQAARDPEVDHDRLALVNGALGGRTASAWSSPTLADYDRVRDSVLRPQGLAEQQVEVAWVKVADARPKSSLPAAQADAYELLGSLGGIARALRSRYPNLQMVFLSSRTYAGYATTDLNPEPYAYESGLAVKWLIQAQIEQMQTGAVDPRAGDLAYERVAPWLAWGPYLWADGANPRSDGLVWLQSDFEGDGTHPSRSGEEKVGRMLLLFFKSSPYTRCWFLSGEVCR